MTDISLTTEELQSRYDFLCKASQPNSQIDVQLQAELSDLEDLVHHDLVELTHKGCPDNITDILKDFENELTRFRIFCEFPDLATKSIVGIGGGFSAGKSTFINRLIGKKCLQVEIDPTTSMPAYVLKGNEESIKAINLHNCAIDLTNEQFASLTHEEKEKYGSQVGLFLQSAFISLPYFTWDNLAILDTPGYSKPEDSSWNERTDENLARNQLNTADYIIWVVPADSGTISEQDIQFISSLNRDIPKLIVLARADKKEPGDIDDIIELIKTTVTNRGIQVLDVVPFSRKKSTNYSLDSIVKHLDRWNKETNPILFAQNFKKLLLDYQSYAEEEVRQVYFRLDKLKRILTMAGEGEIQEDANALLVRVKQEQFSLNELKEALLAFNHDFFIKLKKIGDLAGVPLPEPNALELMDLKQIDLLDMLRELREEREIEEPAFDFFATVFNRPVAPTVLNKLLRQELADKLDFKLPEEREVFSNLSQLLRETEATPDIFNSASYVESNGKSNLPQLLRRTQENNDLKTQIYAIQ